MAHPTVTTRKDSEMEEEREEPGLVEEGEVEVRVRVGVERREERSGGNPVPAVLMLSFLNAQSIVGKIYKLHCVTARFESDH